METEDVLEWFSRVWSWARKTYKRFVEDNFSTGWWDYYYFSVLILSLIFICFIFYKIGSINGFDRGRAQGQAEGFQAGLKSGTQIQVLDVIINESIKAANSSTILKDAGTQ
jgi:hypothetical protein